MESWRDKRRDSGTEFKLLVAAVAAVMGEPATSEGYLTMVTGCRNAFSMRLRFASSAEGLVAGSVRWVCG